MIADGQSTSTKSLRAYQIYFLIAVHLSIMPLVLASSLDEAEQAIKAHEIEYGNKFYTYHKDGIFNKHERLFEGNLALFLHCLICDLVLKMNILYLRYFSVTLIVKCRPMLGCCAIEVHVNSSLYVFMLQFYEALFGLFLYHVIYDVTGPTWSRVDTIFISSLATHTGYTPSTSQQ